MKKLVAMSLVLVMVLAMFAGCAAPAEAPAPAAPAEAAPAAPAEAAPAEAPAADYSSVLLTWATDQVGSSTYNIAVEMSKVLEEAGIGTVDVSPTSPGGMGAPYLFAGDTGIDMAFINAAPARWAHETGTLGREVAGGYNAVMGGLSTVGAVCCIRNAFLEENGVTTIEEIFEKKLPLRFGCSNVGSMDAEVVNLVLEYFGVTEAELESYGGSVTHGGGDEISDLITDGRVDCYIDHTSQSSSTMAEIAMTQEVTFMQWGDDMINWFINEKGFQRVTLPGGSFNGQDKDVIEPGSPDCLFVSDKLDADLVYFITKTLCENREYLVGVYASLTPWDLDLCCTSERIGGNTLHPGAERYFKEKGALK